MSCITELLVVVGPHRQNVTRLTLSQGCPSALVIESPLGGPGCECAPRVLCAHHETRGGSQPRRSAASATTCGKSAETGRLSVPAVPMWSLEWFYRTANLLNLSVEIGIAGFSMSDAVTVRVLLADGMNLSQAVDSSIERSANESSVATATTTIAPPARFAVLRVLRRPNSRTELAAQLPQGVGVLRKSPADLEPDFRHRSLQPNVDSDSETALRPR